MKTFRLCAKEELAVGADTSAGKVDVLVIPRVEKKNRICPLKRSNDSTRAYTIRRSPWRIPRKTVTSYIAKHFPEPDHDVVMGPDSREPGANFGVYR